MQRWCRGEQLRWVIGSKFRQSVNVMAELNPYESPKNPRVREQPLAMVKKTVGFMTLVVLTPIAVLIATGLSCLAVFPTVELVGQATRHLGDAHYTWMIFAGWAMFLIPPIIVLIAMARWGVLTYHREALERKNKLKDLSP